MSTRMRRVAASALLVLSVAPTLAQEATNELGAMPAPEQFPTVEFAFEERSFFRPRYEAPEGPHEWLTRGTFVATLEFDAPPPGAAVPTEDAPLLGAIRIKVYQIK